VKAQAIGSADQTRPPVHNHGTEDGPGLACREYRLSDGTLRGRCLNETALPEAVTPERGAYEIYDSRTGERYGPVLYLSRKQAEDQMTAWQDRHDRGGRPDITREMLLNMDVQKVGADKPERPAGVTLPSWDQKSLVDTLVADFDDGARERLR
jgi:hypothetical protein